MRKIIKGILVVLSLVCQIERTVERIEIEQERSLP